MAPRDDDDDRRRGPMPLIIGGGSSSGRHRALVTVPTKGIAEDRVPSLVKSLNAAGYRVTATAKGLVVPARDAEVVKGFLAAEKNGAAEVTRYDDRWWINLVDAAGELSMVADEDGVDADAADVYLDAHATFVKKGLGNRMKPEPFGVVLGLAEAIAAHLRSGRPERVASTAGRLVDAAQRIR